MSIAIDISTIMTVTYRDLISQCTYNTEWVGCPLLEVKMGDKTYENWVEKYKWIPDYDRDAVWDWYDTYMEKCYGTPTKDIEDLIDLLNEAYKVISYLLDEANRSNSKRFTQGKGMFLIRVPHTKDNYYAKDEDGTLFVTDWALDRMKSFPVNSMTDILFTKDEIKSLGLENCEPIPYLY